MSTQIRVVERAGIASERRPSGMDVVCHENVSGGEDLRNGPEPL